VRIGPHKQLVVVRPVALRNEAGLGALVEAPLLEADREGVHGLGRLLRCERRQHGRVDAAREQHADRNIGQQMRPHRVAQPGAELLDELGLVVASQFVRGTGPGRA